MQGTCIRLNKKKLRSVLGRGLDVVITVKAEARGATLRSDLDLVLR
jgi:hypothetical protein